MKGFAAAFGAVVVLALPGLAPGRTVLHLRATYVGALSPNVIEVRLHSGRHELVHLIGVRGPTACECPTAGLVPLETADAFLVPRQHVLLSGDRRERRRDREGRLIAYVRATFNYVDGSRARDVGSTLLEEGAVRVTGERFARRAGYLAVERAARSQRRGIWHCPEAGTADLALSARADPDPVHVDNPQTFTATVENRGPDVARGVTLVASLPAMTIYALSWGAPGVFGTCSFDYPNSRLLLGYEPEVTCRTAEVPIAGRWPIEMTGLVLGGRMLGVPFASYFHVRSCSADPDPSDNDVMLETHELPPEIR